MEVEQVRAMRVELENNIRKAVHALVDDFQAATGVNVSGVNIESFETAILEGGKRSIITGCNVYLEI